MAFMSLAPAKQVSAAIPIHKAKEIVAMQSHTVAYPDPSPPRAAGSPIAVRARQRLEERFTQGRMVVDAVLDKVESTIPTDYLVPSQSVEFVPADHNVGVRFPKVDTAMTVHGHALGQLADRVNIPSRYVGTLQKEDPALLALNLTGRYRRQDGTKFLARTVDHQLRGWLSANYKRFNAAPLVGAFLDEAVRLGAVPIDGQQLDTKVYMKVLLARVFEPVPNEVLGIGALLRSSDFGDGAYSIALYVERLICLHGAIAENLLRKVHLGSRLDNLEYSNRTHELDTETLVSATRDVVRSLFEPRSIEAKLMAVREANEKEINIRSTVDALRSRAALTKAEAERSLELHNSGGVELLPPVHIGNGGRPKRGIGTAYRLGNVFGLLAQEADAGRALELQDLAGQTMGLQERRAA